jgi:tetratricopeptide (TPR) repeat protein
MLRGIGGIGKTTLGQQFCADAVELDSASMVLFLDCSSLPSNADIASILRLLARAASTTDPVHDPLFRAASELDLLATKVRNAQPASDSSDNDKQEWEALKSLGLEALVLLSAAAIETRLFGQVTSTAQSAVLAGVRAIAETARSARGALVTIASRLFDDNQITSEQLEIARDPERHVTSSLRNFFLSHINEGPLVLFWDKAENLVHQLYRFNEYILQSVTSGQLVVIYAGRLLEIPAPDGSQLPVRQYLPQIPVRAIDLELGVFTVQDAAELLSASFRSRYDRELPSVPSWVTTSLLTISAGLPLWIGLLVDSLMASPFDNWQENVFAARLEEMSKSRSGVDEIMTSLFRDFPTNTNSIDQLPLIAALAIAPESAPNSIILAAAGLPDASALALLSGQYSFMRNDRLHETIRGVVRHYLVTSADGREIARSVAVSLLPWAESLAPTDTVVSDGGDEWAATASLVTEMSYWIDCNLGVRQTVSYTLAALHSGARWLPDLLLSAAWFIERIPITRSSREIVGLTSRVAFQLLISEPLSYGLPNDQVTQVRQSVLGVKRANYEFSFGRNLDRIHGHMNQYDRTKERQIEKESLIGLQALRFRWLVNNGFDEDATELFRKVEGTVRCLPASASLRTYIGISVGGLIERLIGLAPEGEDGRGVVQQVTELGAGLIELDPPSGAEYVAVHMDLLEETGHLDEAVTALMKARASFPGNTKLLGALGYVLTTLGIFDEAARVYGEGVQANGDWLSGWNGRIYALICSGRVNAAYQVAQRGSSIGLAVNPDRLTAYGKSQLQRLIGLYVETAIFSGELESAKMFTEKLPESHSGLSDYHRFMIALFDDDAVAAREHLERVVANSATPDVYACELGIVAHCLNRYDEAANFLSMAVKQPGLARLQDLRLARSAYHADLLSAEMLALIEGSRVPIEAAGGVG